MDGVSAPEHVPVAAPTGTSDLPGAIYQNVAAPQSFIAGKVNAQGDPQSQALNSRSLARPDSTALPELSHATAEVLATVQSRKSTPVCAGPRRGSFQSDIPTGHRMPPPVTPSIPAGLHSYGEGPNGPTAKGSQIPTSADMRSALPNFGVYSSFSDSAADSDPSVRPFKRAAVAGPTSMPSFDPTVVKSNSRESTIHVASAYGSTYFDMSAPSSARTSNSSSRRDRIYVLPDGTVLNTGKGLGRGRPGIKRGPRKPKNGGAELIPPAAPTVSTPAPSPGVGHKRRRSSASADDHRMKSRASVSEEEDEIFSDSDDYNPQTTQTRSGRHTQKPSTFVPTDSPVTKKPRLSKEPSTSHSRTPLIKRKVYRGKEQSALCEHCLRGHGPIGNAIVFCDGCNRCWHQRCHDPMIAKELVVNSKAEWFCKECTDALRKTGKISAATSLHHTGRPSGSASSSSLPAAISLAPHSVIQENVATVKAPPTAVPLVGGRPWTPEQRQQYLHSLSHAQLVDLLLHASQLAPDLPLFPTQTQAPRATLPFLTSTNITATVPAVSTTQSAASVDLMKPPPSPVPSTKPRVQYQEAASRSTSHSTASTEPEEQEEEKEEDLYEYLDEHARLYPNAGHGVAAILPPEAVDLHILLEGPECRTFSHTLRQGLVVG